MKWFHLHLVISNDTQITMHQMTYVLASPYSSAGALMICRPSLHRLHLNVSWVSHSVFSLNKKSFRRESREK